MKYIKFPVEFICQSSRATSQAELLTVTAKWLPEIIKADRASVALSDEDDQLRIFAIEGNDAVQTNKTMPIAETFIGRAYLSESALYCPDMSRETELMDCKILSGAGLHSCIDAPLRSGDTCFGTLNIAHEEVDYYSDEDISIMQSLSLGLATHLHALDQVDQLRVLASIDGLTKFLNRRVFLSHGDRVFDRWSDTNAHFSCAVVDIDFFKKVNDEFGHAGGDAALTEFSKHIRSQLRKDDIVGRLGGEEFGVILPGMNCIEAEQWADRLRKSVSELRVAFGDKAIQFTLSIGVAQPQKQDDGFPSLLKRADTNLYSAKSTGRNRVIAA